MKRLLLFSISILLVACNDEMDDQPRFGPMESSPLFDNGSSAGTPPAHTIARGNLRTDSALYFGTKPGSTEAVAKSPLPFTTERLARGREVFNINCAVCHGADGYARGIVVRRGFPPPPSYHSPRLRAAPDGHLFDVISNGYGKMYAYKSRVTVADRWAVVGYIRALQRSQNASLADVADRAEQDKLTAERRAAP